MAKRWLALGILAALLAGASGCCGDPIRGLEQAHRRHHYGCSQCGELYWSEWFCDPPACCDPCNNCGEYIGPQPCRRCENPRACTGPLCAECSTCSTCSTCGGDSHARRAHEPMIVDEDEGEVVYEDQRGRAQQITSPRRPRIAE